MKVDATNIEIIRQLRNGRKSYKAIGNKQQITENTLRSRVKRMIEEGLLDISGNVCVDLLPGHQMLYLGIKLTSKFEAPLILQHQGRRRSLSKIKKEQATTRLGAITVTGEKFISRADTP